jgi:hypothetical protein
MLQLDVIGAVQVDSVPFVAAAIAVGARGCWPAFAQKPLSKSPLAVYRCERHFGQMRFEMELVFDRMPNDETNAQLLDCCVNLGLR